MQRYDRRKVALSSLSPEMLKELAKDASFFADSFDRLRQQAKDLMDDFARNVQDYRAIYDAPTPELQALHDHFLEAAAEVDEAWLGSDNAHQELLDVVMEANKLLGIKAASARVAYRYTFPRESYVPAKVRDEKPFVPEGTDLAIWQWDGESPNGTKYFGAIAFAGKAQKPLWHYHFRDESSRQRQIDKSIEGRKSLMDAKKKRQEERKQWKHDLKEGDILYTSWGYDQTNVEFYQVVEVRGAMVVVREIAEKVVSEGHGSDSVVAQPNQFIGPPIKRRPTGGSYTTTVKITDVQRAHPWDGRPTHQTSWGYGH